ncbi:hypothetical protein KIL84_012519 [Mauremys mutica]|uniref:Uncharacterized protein n=1 Tax=Mauremys mutica TaxID=74926 RepID=A0A9D3XR57_9SAUR|nr:hypothetical protein KIL84_012519 [Mauremys mutica]
MPAQTNCKEAGFECNTARATRAQLLPPTHTHIHTSPRRPILACDPLRSLNNAATWGCFSPFPAATGLNAGGARRGVGERRLAAHLRLLLLLQELRGADISALRCDRGSAPRLRIQRLGPGEGGRCDLLTCGCSRGSAPAEMARPGQGS